MIKKLFSLLFFLALVGGGYWVLNNRSVGLKSDYQAVFLSNGQVYFGKLKKPTSEYPVLEDVYYLVVQRPLQQAAAAAAAEEGDVITGGEALETGKPQFTLVKLGGELHGPQNEMKLNRRHILFIEDLKEDSKVVQKIKDYEVGGGESVQTPQEQTPVVSEEPLEPSDDESEEAASEEDTEETEEAEVVEE